MKRLFIAVDISDEARSIAADLIRGVRKDRPAKGITFVKPENLHITIKFLGDTDADTEAKLIAALAEIAQTFPPLTLRLGLPEVLGRRVMSIKIDTDTPTLSDLEKRIDTECQRLGFKPDARRFHPHLTLARIRQPAAPLVTQFLQTRIEPAPFPVRHITLYQSTLTPSGSVYTELKILS